MMYYSFIKFLIIILKNKNKLKIKNTHYILHYRRTAGPQNRRTAGPQDRRTAGPLDRWTAGTQDHRTAGPNKKKKVFTKCSLIKRSLKK